MKYAIAIIAFVFILAAVGKAQSFYGTEDVESFRRERDREFRDKKTSPLLNEDFLKFKGLNYFEIDEKFKVKAEFTETPDEKYFMMPTSSGVAAKYVKVGVVKFQLDGKEHSLAVYQSEKALTDKAWREKYGHAYFIPFRDLTNGKETYGGGRYIYWKIPKSKDAFLDFNLAFNPSCAYGSDKFSCPIPPRENFLQVRITAGEKKFESFVKKP
jgi:uncharacterized protein (DUF1684 family)